MPPARKRAALAPWTPCSRDPAANMRMRIAFAVNNCRRAGTSSMSSPTRALWPRFPAFHCRAPRTARYSARQVASRPAARRQSLRRSYISSWRAAALLRVASAGPALVPKWIDSSPCHVAALRHDESPCADGPAGQGCRRKLRCDELTPRAPGPAARTAARGAPIEPKLCCPTDSCA